METQTPSTALKVGRASRRKILFRIFILAFPIFFFVSVPPAHAASFSISPSSQSISAGETFSVNVLVNAPNESTNAAEAVISFPANKLRVISLKDTDSIFNLWVKRPSFSNSLGTIDFSGVILAPGFTGQAGKVFSVNFKSLAPGSAPVIFISGAILADDGKGTNVLSELGDANYFISPATSPVPSPKRLEEEPVPRTIAEEEKPAEIPAPATTIEEGKMSEQIPVTQEATSIPGEESAPNSSQLIIQILNLAILFFLLVLLWYLWKRLSSVARELEDLEVEKYRRLDLLRQNIKKRITTLEEIESRKGLTIEERAIFDELRSELAKTSWPNR